MEIEETGLFNFAARIIRVISHAHQSARHNFFQRIGTKYSIKRCPVMKINPFKGDINLKNMGQEQFRKKQ